jgi:LacI family transcriptional regulator
MNIVEFANIAGCSSATVSRAFHEPGKTRNATRQHILELAEKLGYYPNASGRALVTGIHDVLGLVWPLEVEGPSGLYAVRVLAALTEQLERNDLDLLICPVDRRRPKALEHAHRTMCRSRCDAWILLYPRHNDPLIRSLRASQKPVICLMGHVEECPDWKYVVLNQASWIKQALKWFKARGANRVLFLGHGRHELDHEERMAMFNKLAPRYFGINVLMHSTWPLNTAEVGALLAAKKVDAVIGVDDAAALVAARAIQLSGDRRLKKVQIVGIDDSPEAARFNPPIATFRPPLDEMTACAVDLALGRPVKSQRFEAAFIDRVGAKNTAVQRTGSGIQGGDGAIQNLLAGGPSGAELDPQLASSHLT